MINLDIFFNLFKRNFVINTFKSVLDICARHNLSLASIIRDTILTPWSTTVPTYNNNKLVKGIKHQIDHLFEPTSSLHGALLLLPRLIRRLVKVIKHQNNQLLETTSSLHGAQLFLPKKK